LIDISIPAHRGCVAALIAALVFAGGRGVPFGRSSSKHGRLEPAGAWMLSQSGAWEDVSWKTFTAPSTRGGVCESVSLSPAPIKFIPGRLSYQGMPVACSSRPAFVSLRVDPIVALLLVEEPKARYNVVSGVADKAVAHLAVHLDDGSTRTVFPVNGTFIFFYKPTQTLRELAVFVQTDRVVSVCKVSLLPEGPRHLGCGSS
jgi:hypothetical protein